MKADYLGPPYFNRIVTLPLNDHQTSHFFLNPFLNFATEKLKLSLDFFFPMHLVSKSRVSDMHSVNTEKI